MNERAFERLERLREQCAAALRDKRHQSLTIWRGDMWAVIGAHHDIQKMRKAKPRALPAPPQETT